MFALSEHFLVHVCNVTQLNCSMLVGAQKLTGSQNNLPHAQIEMNEEKLKRKTDEE